ncbi:hypothetical protein T4B_9655 [Trichinella pseudospiralis]|uniref:Uncharacterized protein n=1 Tax=Trichinella pseudospiralis TaxID=6337 RepID=A0A0V1JVG8_TRIPS|nr:hypothetical protein T4B_9655 [Trichinella pseudospiralis]KRZ38925.1 hypothetical protein T4C_9752 [Trichinella pseudospiralis]
MYIKHINIISKSNVHYLKNQDQNPSLCLEFINNHKRFMKNASLKLQASILTRLPDAVGHRLQ